MYIASRCALAPDPVPIIGERRKIFSTREEVIAGDVGRFLVDTDISAFNAASTALGLAYGYDWPAPDATPLLYVCQWPKYLYEVWFSSILPRPRNIEVHGLHVWVARPNGSRLC